MLKLNNITKIYGIKGGASVVALKDVNISFRQSEFVSILGPSGCGKTTLLNLVGGLDKFTQGELYINNKKTAHFKESEWDAYRNHKIGFVFQNYNLISHQTVLSNVEIALTLSGLNFKRRREMARQALINVGLGEQILKKPNQLSGGQMQRVAIARALVNNPDILLADEPTGALDTTTSKQIMELLKEISLNKLVIMVTHNEEIAKNYSSRIISLLDGKIINDTNVFDYEVDEGASAVESALHKSTKQAKFSFFKKGIKINNATNQTHAGLSIAVNDEDATVAFKVEGESANDIGAAAKRKTGGVANNAKTVMKESQTKLNAESLERVGEGEYVPKKAANAVSSESSEWQGKPKKQKGERTSMSILSALKLSLSNLTTKKVRTILTSVAGSIGIIGVALVLSLSNGVNIYMEDLQKSTLQNSPLTVSQNSINIDAMMSVKDNQYLNYTKFPNDMAVMPFNPGDLMYHKNNITGDYINHVNGIDGKLLNAVQFSYNIKFNMLAENSSAYYKLENRNLGMQELLKGDFYAPEYEVLSGSMPNENNPGEIVLVVDAYNRVDSSIFAELGVSADGDKIPFEKIINKNFKLVLNDDFYSYDSVRNRFDENKSYAQVYANANNIDLKIVGVIRQRKDSNTSLLNSGLYYQNTLTQLVLENSLKSEIVTEQKKEENSAINLISGKLFDGLYTLSAHMQSIGGEKVPTSISIYPINFDAKSEIKKYLAQYNINKPTNERVLVDDFAELISNTFSTMVNTVSIVLIAFAGISLLVSSVMIGIITYVSVVERTKEIGILRSLGARKRDISRVFNAETLIIGFCAGTIGVLLTYLINIPVSIIVKSLVGVSNIANLNPLAALIMVAVSMALTFIAGLIPARIASRKDAVVALRTE